MEEIFEIIEIADIDMNPPHPMTEPIVDRNFGNTIQHNNGPNKRQHTHKNNIKYYQHINTSQLYQHSNISRQYQPISFQRSRKSSIPYLE